MAIFSTHHVLITGLLEDLRSADPVVQASAVERLRAHRSDPLLRLRHDAVLARATRETRFAELAGIVDLHRIALTYVTNKKGKDQLLSALQSVDFEDYRRDGRTVGQLDNRLILGGVDVAAIQDIIRLAETAPVAEGRALDELLRGIVATSAISHGVDVDRFNAMYFAGMPPDIAEYIQASSRVGRTHVGFVVLIPTLQARRDRFVVEVHEVYHRFLERMIAPPAVERWADRAVERVVPSLFQTWLIGIMSQRPFLAAADDRKHRARRFKTADDIEHFLRAQGRRRVITEARDFILAAIGADHPTWHAADRPHYADLLERALNDIVLQVESGFYAGTTLPQFWKACPNVAHAPMTSLRDVDTGGVIYPSRYTDRMQSIRSDDIRGFIRTGRAGGPADAEIDTDTKVGLAIDAGQ